ncbi:hypothetical protein [Vibrio nigripulchritudo]|uniref:hypothetical protein n=1 Tax=Vibrio nigripulchritudo TaxID=28173 RepID=UPI0003B1AE49|nr:hypothetical protein [Vibrio nigripulchritudo]CCN69795.1 hypothetical protein VIBNISFn118_150049 [Vibrio nigripulchritudo SFn118]
MSWVNLSSVSVTNNSKVVSINDGLSSAGIRPGDGIQIKGFELYEVDGVFAHQLTLKTAWSNPSQTNAVAVIVPTFGDFNQAVEQIRNIASVTQGNMAEMEKWWTEESDITFKDYEGRLHTVRSAKKMDKDVQAIVDQNINLRFGASSSFRVSGDANTFYPVLIHGNTNFDFADISISRGYNWTAPNSWNTATHKGGLTLNFLWAGDGSWGGNAKTIRIVEYSEQYSRIFGGMQLSTGGVIVWLRGGGAAYRLSSSNGRATRAAVYVTDTYKDAAGNTFIPRTLTQANTGREASQNAYWPIRGNNSAVLRDLRVMHSLISSDQIKADNGFYWGNESLDHRYIKASALAGEPWSRLGDTQGGQNDGYDSWNYKCIELANKGRVDYVFRIDIHGDTNWAGSLGQFEIRVCRYQADPVGQVHVDMQCINGNPESLLLKIKKESGRTKIFVRANRKWGHIYFQEVKTPYGGELPTVRGSSNRVFDSSSELNGYKLVRPNQYYNGDNDSVGQYTLYGKPNGIKYSKSGSGAPTGSDIPTAGGIFIRAGATKEIWLNDNGAMIKIV